MGGDHAEASHLTESSYSHLCLDASTDGATSRITPHNLPHPLNNSQDDGMF